MKNKISLALITMLAFALRFYRLGNFPPLNADEAAIGYNAWSLIQTGMDEHGNPWPIHFQSFNDYKPGLFFYLVLPFVRLLGLNEWSVRIPGAVLGVATVPVVYLLVLELGKLGVLKKLGDKIAITSALFLAISPWHIHFSRGGWEVNAATFFITTGVWLFLKALKNPKHYVLSILSFVASLYAYHAARVVVPLLILGFIVLYWKDLLKNAKQVLVAGAFGLILLIPLAKDLAGPAGISRAAGVGILADPGPLNEINEQRGEHENLKSIKARLFHNKPANYGLSFLENWTEHYSGEFLFLSGDDIQRNKVPEMGQMYLHDAFFVLIGLLAILRSIGHWQPLILWLLVAPAAAALTFQSPHALRAQNMVVPLVVISAVGAITVIEWYKKTFRNRFFLTALYILLATFIFWGFARYQHLYWVQMPRAYPFSSQYGFKELVAYINQEGDKYEKIVITDRYDQPYILTLFYLSYPPKKFQGHHQLTARDGFGFSTVREFGKFTFISLGEWSDITNGYPGALIVGTEEEVPDAGNIVKTISFPSGETAFKLVAN